MTGPAAFYRGTYLLAFRWTRLSEDAHAPLQQRKSRVAALLY